LLPYSFPTFRKV
jgi:zinc transporter, ZIP family